MIGYGDYDYFYYKYALENNKLTIYVGENLYYIFEFIENGLIVTTSGVEVEYTANAELTDEEYEFYNTKDSTGSVYLGEPYISSETGKILIVYDNGVERYNSSLERERMTSYGYDFEIKNNEIILTAHDANNTQYIININSDTELEFEGTVYTKATWQDINV